MGSAAAGLVQLVTDIQPSNIAATATPIVATVWSVLLVLGGVTVVVGAWIRPVVLGLQLEAAGHLALAGGLAAYIAAAIMWMDAPWWASAVAVASAIRWSQIWHVMWTVRHV